MKKTYSILILFLLANVVFAQTPELLNYQAVIRNVSGELLQNETIGFKIGILKGSPTGAVVYSETHTVSTDDNGLVVFKIGEGTTTDDISTIDWSDGTYHLKTETDLSGGTNYTVLGTSQLSSVPYALHAKSASSINGEEALEGIPISIDQIDKNTSFAFSEVTTVYDPDTGNATSNPVIVHAYSGETGIWSSITTTFDSINEIMASNGNFVFSEVTTVYDPDTGSATSNPVIVHAYSGETGTWSSITTTYDSINEIMASNGNFIFSEVTTVYDPDTGSATSNPVIVHSFSKKMGQWSSVTTNYDSINAIGISNENFIFSEVTTVYDPDTGNATLNPVIVHAYSGETGIWSSITTTYNSINGISGSNGNFIFSEVTTVYDPDTGNATSNPVIVHTFNGKNGVWSSVTSTFNSINNLIISESNN